MRERRSGTIVHISSVSRRMAGPLRAWNHGAKLALESLSDSLRLEFKPFGIDVLSLIPMQFEPNLPTSRSTRSVLRPVPDPTARSRRQSSSQWQMKTWSDASRHPRQLPTQFVGQ
jgi:short-subunit dehydrogenase